MKRNEICIGLIVLSLLLAGCANTPQQQPQIQRISPEELDRVMPRPQPTLPLTEVVKLSKAGESAEAIIAKIKQSNSHYALTPSQVIDLSRQGVDARVLDFMAEAREQMLRDGCADEINRREQENLNKQEQLKRELRLRSYPPYYDPFWPYPYWRYPYYPRGFYW